MARTKSYYGRQVLECPYRTETWLLRFDSFEELETALATGAVTMRVETGNCHPDLARGIREFLRGDVVDNRLLIWTKQRMRR